MQNGIIPLGLPSVEVAAAAGVASAACSPARHMRSDLIHINLYLSYSRAIYKSTCFRVERQRRWATVAVAGCIERLE